MIFLKPSEAQRGDPGHAKVASCRIWLSTSTLCEPAHSTRKWAHEDAPPSFSLSSASQRAWLCKKIHFLVLWSILFHCINGSKCRVHLVGLKWSPLILLKDVLFTLSLRTEYLVKRWTCVGWTVFSPLPLESHAVTKYLTKKINIYP